PAWCDGRSHLTFGIKIKDHPNGSVPSLSRPLHPRPARPRAHARIDPMSALLLRQVRVVPLDGQAAADPVDVLIEDGVIAGLGPADGAHRVPTVTVPTVEGEGRWLIPGLWDAHVHLGQWALAGRRLDLARTSSPEEVLTIVAQTARERGASDR